MRVSSDLKAPFTVKPRRERFAATIGSLDLGRKLDIVTFARLHRAWMNNPILIFPDQGITDDQQISLLRSLAIWRSIHRQRIDPLCIPRSTGWRMSTRRDGSWNRKAPPGNTWNLPGSGTPTALFEKSRPWDRSCMASRFRRRAAIHCSPT